MLIAQPGTGIYILSGFKQIQLNANLTHNIMQACGNVKICAVHTSLCDTLANQW